MHPWFCRLGPEQQLRIPASYPQQSEKETWFVFIIEHRTDMSRKLSVFYSVFADPGSSAFVTPGSGIRIQDGKNLDPGYGINIPNHTLFPRASTVTRFWVKNTSILCCLSGSGSGIRCLFGTESGMEKFGSGIRGFICYFFVVIHLNASTFFHVFTKNVKKAREVQ